MLHEEFQHNGYTIEIHTDEDPQSPREWDNLGEILYTSTRYVLGDRCVSKEEIDEIIKRKDVIWLPVYAYIHGGTTINTTGFSCPWDSGQCGIIYVEYAKVLKEFGRKRMTVKFRARIEKYLKNEVATLDQYYQGDVYGYIIKKVKDASWCSEGDEEEIGSCWGFFGEEYCREEAIQEADADAELLKKAS